MRLEYNVHLRYNMAIHYMTEYQKINAANNNCFYRLNEYNQARSLYVNIEQMIMRDGYVEEDIVLVFIRAVVDLVELIESEMSERAWKPYEEDNSPV